MFSLKCIIGNITRTNQKKSDKLSLLNFPLILQSKAFTDLVTAVDELSPRKQMDQEIAVSTASVFMGMLRVGLVHQRENKSPICFCF